LLIWTKVKLKKVATAAYQSNYDNKKPHLEINP
jgi:hypothetical protein